MKHHLNKIRQKSENLQVTSELADFQGRWNLVDAMMSGITCINTVISKQIYETGHIMPMM